MILRSATMADAKFIFDLRNLAQDSHCYRHFVAWPEHLAWVRSSTDPDRVLLIAVEGSERIGVFRAELNADSWELGWMLVPEHRGKGLGTCLARLGADYMKRQHYDDWTIIIPSDNPKSRAIARAIGAEKIIGTHERFKPL